MQHSNVEMWISYSMYVCVFFVVTCILCLITIVFEKTLMAIVVSCRCALANSTSPVPYENSIPLLPSLAMRSVYYVLVFVDEIMYFTFSSFSDRSNMWMYLVVQMVYPILFCF